VRVLQATPGGTVGEGETKLDWEGDFVPHER